MEFNMLDLIMGIVLFAFFVFIIRLIWRYMREEA